MPNSGPIAANAADMVIDARNVSLSLGEGEARVEILKGVDLKVGASERLAILGPSGSGKSSLMAVLSGLESASGGTIRVAGGSGSSCRPFT